MTLGRACHGRLRADVDRRARIDRTLQVRGVRQADTHGQIERCRGTHRRVFLREADLALQPLHQVGGLPARDNAESRIIGDLESRDVLYVLAGARHRRVRDRIDAATRDAAQLTEATVLQNERGPRVVTVRAAGRHGVFDLQRRIELHIGTGRILHRGELVPGIRQRSRPWRSFKRLIRPSLPVRHFWALRNQRCFSSFLRSGLLVERLGMATRLTSRECAPASLRWEKNAADIFGVICGWQKHTDGGGCRTCTPLQDLVPWRSYTNSSVTRKRG
jgi:hypothetical protein